MSLLSCFSHGVGKLSALCRYMKRRCVFLDNCPGFNLNCGRGYYKSGKGEPIDITDTKLLGSTLMEVMLKEVKHFCDSNIKSPEQVCHVMRIVRTEMTALNSLDLSPFYLASLSFLSSIPLPTPLYPPTISLCLPSPPSFPLF